MKIDYVENNCSSRLLLIFAGWAGDANPFFGLHRQGYDIAVAYDYRTFDNCQEVLSGYEEICIVAWSFGVIAATTFIHAHPELPITARIAVNGTLQPVSDTCGIPEAVFQATLRTLSPASYQKFERRMCGSAAKLAEYHRNAPEREFAELADELRSIASLPHMVQCASLWDVVYISDSDYIIPTENQRRAWAGHFGVRQIEGAHFPPFQWIVDSNLIDKSLVATRFGRASSTYERSASVQRQISDRLAEILNCRIPHLRPGSILEFGVGTGFLTRRLYELYNPNSHLLLDIAAIPAELPGEHRICDAELELLRLPDQSFDMIAGSSAIQWFNSPLTFLRNCRRCLRSGGVVALSAFGPDNFAELRDYLPAQLSYGDVDRWQKQLNASGFEVKEVVDEHIALSFTSTAELLKHIRQTGVNALTSSVGSALQIARSGLTSLTYHPVYIIAVHTSK